MVGRIVGVESVGGAVEIGTSLLTFLIWATVLIGNVIEVIVSELLVSSVVMFAPKSVKVAFKVVNIVGEIVVVLFDRMEIFVVMVALLDLFVSRKIAILARKISHIVIATIIIPVLNDIVKFNTVLQDVVL